MNLSRQGRLVWWAGLIVAGYLTFHPAANLLTRGASLLFVAMLVVSVLTLLGKRGRWTVGGVVVVAALIVLIPWPVRTSALELRTEYVKQLPRYTGCTYYWGGESRRGIDCSGLIRRGMIDACVAKGWTDPGLLHVAASLWWHDTSAKALGEGHAGLTRPLFDTPSINGLDHQKLQPGDLAVTTDGLHILAYLGSLTWIEADPGKLVVIEEKAPSKANPWLATPMKLVRWMRLEPGN